MAAQPEVDLDVSCDDGSKDTPQRPPSIRTVSTPAAPSIRQSRTERPVEPDHLYKSFVLKEDEEIPIGNKEFMFTLKMDGRLGVFYDRDRTTRIPTYVEIDVVNVRNAAITTLYIVIERLLVDSKSMDSVAIATYATNMATILANGIMVMFYQKLRYVNYLDTQVMDRFYKKPKVPVPFEVPQPYALAISQLGQVKPSGLDTETYFSPVATKAAASNFCLPADGHWSPLIYARMVEHAKKIGLQFAPVDLQVKMGSTWWLYRQNETEEMFSLQCPLPEENFTKATAVLHSLFCINMEGGFLNPIFNLDPVGTATYGTMMRNPPERVDTSTYFAIDNGVEIIWKIA